MCAKKVSCIGVYDRIHRGCCIFVVLNCILLYDVIVFVVLVVVALVIVLVVVISMVCRRGICCLLFAGT